jgi:cyclic-di-AMP phosphodiesterase PgpH
MKNLRARKFVSTFSSVVMALIFGALWLGIQSFELFGESWEAKFGRAAPVTVRLPSSYFRITMLRSEFHYLTTTSSECPHLLPRGSELQRGKECSELVRAFERARRPVLSLRLLGQLAFCAVVALLLGAFIRREGTGRARWLRCHVTVFVLLTLVLAGSKAILLLTSLPAQIMPIALVPLLTSHFLGRRVSYGVVFASALLASALVNYDIELLLFHGVVGVAAVLALRPRRRATVHFRAAAAAAWVAVLASAVTTLLFSGTLDIYDDVHEHINPRYSIWLASLLSGLGSGVLAWMATPIVGLAVAEVSRDKLLDLQDLDHPLLRRLRERAPSTWEHSRAMANLAEAAAHAIAANALLVRVGAYFHDVGKSSRPAYFIENQDGGENPHDELEPGESARAIFRHVTEGVRLLRKEGVPEDVIEFAYSHHGTSLLEYFWHKNLEAGNPLEQEERDYTYPGHLPSTRETGILMLVDAIEAAARTVDQPEKAQFEALVRRIVFAKLSQGQLDESGLSVGDLRVVSNTLIATLVSMYHGRIKYPWQTESSAEVTTGGVAEQPTPSSAVTTGGDNGPAPGAVPTTPTGGAVPQPHPATAPDASSADSDGEPLEPALSGSASPAPSEPEPPAPSEPAPPTPPEPEPTPSPPAPATHSDTYTGPAPTPSPPEDDKKSES